MKKLHYHPLSLIEKYLKYLKFNKSCSHLTLKAYQKDLHQFFSESMNQQKKEDLKPSNSKKILTLFIKNRLRSSLKSWNRWSPATRNRKIASLKSFFKWLYQENYIGEDLNQKMKTPKVPLKLPHYLSLDEVMTLIQVVSKNQSENQSKNQKDHAWAIKELSLILLLYGGGLRVSEACAVEWKHIHFSNHTLKVKGKGNKERIVVLPSMVFQWLKKLKNLENTKFVFGHQPLHPRKAFTIVQKWGVKAGLQKPISPHVLRHSYATHLLESGSDLRIIQSLLGHQSLAATQKYTQIQLSKLNRTLSTHHPLNTMKKKVN